MTLHILPRYPVFYIKEGIVLMYLPGVNKMTAGQMFAMWFKFVTMILAINHFTIKIEGCISNFDDFIIRLWLSMDQFGFTNMMQFTSMTVGQ